MSIVHKGLQPQPPFPWLTGSWRQALVKIHSRRMPHAWLICGADGIGTMEFALAVAQYLLCIAPHETGVCGRCKACLLLRADSHPDLMLLRPEAAGKAVKIDQVRDVGEFVAQTAQQGGRKIVIVHPAERMNQNASNALLKGLEEPQGDCVFLLVSDTPALLLATIRSRCQRLDLAAPAEDIAASWLEEQGVDEARIRLHLAGGRPLRVLTWLEQGLFDQRRTLATALSGVLKNEMSPAEAGKALLKFDLVWLIEQMLLLLASAIRSVQAESLGQTQIDEVEAVLARKAPSQLFDLYDRLLQSKRQLLTGANPNAELLLNDLMVEFSSGVMKIS